jgi:predicted nucleic-acid-binding Zn-ribbon protein
VSEIKKCPKCSGEMAGDKRLGSYTEITLKKEDQFIGDTILTFYCVNCGYMELYREEKKKSRETSR